MIRQFRTSMLSTAGASAAEYALMIAFIAGVIVLGATALGTNVKAVFNDFSPKMTTPS